MFDVFLLRHDNYDLDAIVQRVDQIAVASGHFTNMNGSTVLLKPNLLSARGQDLSCSDPVFIAAVASWFVDHGARVVLGDSPAFGSARSVCRTRGITAAVERLGVRIVNFKTPVETNLPCGRNIAIAREALDCDYFIGLPRLKAHNQMYMTLAVKNVYGIVKGSRKALVHMTCNNSHLNFSRIILDLVSLLPRQFHIVEGITAMSRSGPMDGDALPLGCIAGGASPLAIDTALIDLLELDASKNPISVAAKKDGRADVGLASINFPFLRPDAFHGSGFIAPDVLNPVRFNPFRFLRGMLKRIGLQQDS